jgi:hypothetical protein
VLRILTILGHTDGGLAEPKTSTESYQRSLRFAS